MALGGLLVICSGPAALAVSVVAIFLDEVKWPAFVVAVLSMAFTAYLVISMFS